MADGSKLLERAARLRDLAKRAKRLAGTVSREDSETLVTYAKVLEEQAADLEKRAAAKP
jgi:hypothetical protein